MHTKFMSARTRTCVCIGLLEVDTRASLHYNCTREIINYVVLIRSYGPEELSTKFKLISSEYVTSSK